MNNRFMSVIVAAAFASASVLQAQVVTLPTVEMLGGQYYYYTVEDGDSAYGIAKKFGWDYEELCRLNPNVVKNMKKGALIYYPTGADTANAAQVIPDETHEFKVITHVVRKGDTVYSIAAKYGVPLETIYANHPSAREGIKEGETISINRSQKSSDNIAAATTTPTVKPAEVKEAEVAPAPVAEASVETPPVTSAPAAPATPATVPEERYVGVVDVTDVVEGRTVNTGDINKERVSNIAVLLDNPQLQRDREFMRGFIIALEEMETLGQRVKLTAIDATRGREAVITALDALKPDMIVLTYDKNIPEWVVSYGNSHKMPVANVFDVKYEGTASNPSVLQLMSPSKVFNEQIANYAASSFDDFKLMFVGAPSAGDGIAQELMKRWDEANTVTAELDNLLDKQLGADRKYLFYINETSKEDIKKALDEIAKLREQTPMATVKIFGRPNWVTYAAELSDDFAKNDVYIPSRFYFDWNEAISQDFVKRYEELFHKRPSLTFPIYSATGYDVAQCFIPSLAANGGDFDRGMLRGRTIQSDFLLEKSDSEGGFVNKGVYVVRFTPFGTVEKIIAE